MKLQLDLYKDVSKDKRDKIQMMATEKKLRSEIEVLRHQIKKTQVENTHSNIIEHLKESIFYSQSLKHEDSKKLAHEDALRKIKQLEQKNCDLQKQVSNFKQSGSSFVGSVVSNNFS